MEVVNGNLIVQKVTRGEQPEALLLKKDKAVAKKVATYEVIIGSEEYKSGMLVLLDEHDLLDWNGEDFIIKETDVIMRGGNE